MKYRIRFFLALISAVLLLASCSGVSYEETASTRAKKYIQDKYGFSAEVKDVVLSQNGWLEFSFEAPSLANVLMEYNGREFGVLVPVRENSEAGFADNYESDSICSDIESYVRSTLNCEKCRIRIDYGVNYGRNMLPKEIRSADDLARLKNDTIISVYTYGLDPDSVNMLDTRKYGEKTRFGIADMLDPDLPEPGYGTMLELPDDGGWNVGGMFITDSDGKWDQKIYESIVIDNVCLVMPTKCAIEFGKADGTGNPGDEPVTDWYSMRGTGEGYGKFYVSVDDRLAEYCIEYIGKDGAYYERIPHVDAEGARYELCAQRYCSGRGAEIIFRVVKRDFYADQQ